MYETRGFIDLGFSNICQYAEEYFGLQGSQTYALIRTARRLRDLPRSTETLLAGKISWSAVEEIARIATVETEDDWLGFAQGRSFEALKAEVKDAEAKNRKTPRQDRYGIPNLKSRFIVELSPEEREMLDKALMKARHEIGESLDGALVDNREALLYLSKLLLETEPSGEPKGRVKREEPIFDILYHVCPSCQGSHVLTKEGPVEVPGEVVKRVEGVARRVEISPEEELEVEPLPGGEKDRPNDARISRKARLRDGNACASPFCRRREGLHAHHIRFRMKGGPTELFNETTVCSICHDLLHLGLLEVKGDPSGMLRWTRKADRLQAQEEELAEVKKLPAVIPVLGTAAAPPADCGIPQKPATAEGLPRQVLENLTQALQTLGYARQEAKDRVIRAFKRLLERLGSMPRENEVLRAALSGRT